MNTSKIIVEKVLKENRNTLLLYILDRYVRRGTSKNFDLTGDRIDRWKRWWRSRFVHSFKWIPGYIIDRHCGYFNIITALSMAFLRVIETNGFRNNDLYTSVDKSIFWPRTSCASGASVSFNTARYTCRSSWRRGCFLTRQFDLNVCSIWHVNM